MINVTYNPARTIASSLQRFFGDRGWEVSVQPSYTGGATGVFWMDIDGKRFECPFNLSATDLMSSPMEIFGKIDGIREDIVRRMNSGVAI